MCASWENFSSKYGFKDIQSSFARGKNTSDMELVTDALQLYFERRSFGQAFDCCVVVSGDADFAPFAGLLREHGVYVIGAGREGQTSLNFVNACSEFFYPVMLAGNRQGGARYVLANIKTPVQDFATPVSLNKQEEVLRLESPVERKKLTPPSEKETQTKTPTTASPKPIVTPLIRRRDARTVEELHAALAKNLPRFYGSNGYVKGCDFGKIIEKQVWTDLGFATSGKFFNSFPDRYESFVGSGNGNHRFVRLKPAAKPLADAPKISDKSGVESVEISPASVVTPAPASVEVPPPPAVSPAPALIEVSSTPAATANNSGLFPRLQPVATAKIKSVEELHEVILARLPIFIRDDGFVQS
ncbi:MAG: NYN domain-containing protein, partial [Thermoguttaceae bacterium]|nr:NYN domain-containing protein [Thermoguttaceae bacterium]